MTINIVDLVIPRLSKRLVDFICKDWIEPRVIISRKIFYRFNILVWNTNRTLLIHLNTRVWFVQHPGWIIQEVSLRQFLLRLPHWHENRENGGLVMCSWRHRHSGSKDVQWCVPGPNWRGVKVRAIVTSYDGGLTLAPWLLTRPSASPYVWTSQSMTSTKEHLNEWRRLKVSYQTTTNRLRSVWVLL